MLQTPEKSEPVLADKEVNKLNTDAFSSIKCSSFLHVKYKVDWQRGQQAEDSCMCKFSYIKLDSFLNINMFKL